MDSKSNFLVYVTGWPCLSVLFVITVHVEFSNKCLILNDAHDVTEAQK